MLLMRKSQKQPNNYSQIKSPTLTRSGMILSGDEQQGEWNSIQLLAEGKDSLIKLVDGDRRE